MPPSRRWLPGRVPALPGCSRRSLGDVPAGIAIGMIATARQTAHQWTYRDDLALEKHTRPLAEVLTGNGLVLLERLHLRPQLATLRIKGELSSLHRLPGAVDRHRLLDVFFV